MKKLKKINLFSIALIAIFTLIACEKDLYEDAIQQNQDKQINIKQISLEQFNSKLVQMKNKPEIEGFMVSSNSNYFQNRASNGSEFEIITDDIKEITQGDYTSYTMYVKTPDTTNSIYNITIEEVNDNTSLFITKYKPSNNWTITSNRNFEGNVITYRISGTTNDPVVLASLFTEAFEGLQEGGYNGIGTGSGGSNSSNYYPYDCDGIVQTTYLLEPHSCHSGNHMPWQACNYLNPSFQEYDPSKGPYYELIPYYTCIPDYTPVDGDIPNPGDTPGGGGEGNTGNNNAGGNTSLTTIVNPTEEEKKTPCEELIENDSISDFNAKMEELKIKAGTQDFESAHVLYKNPSSELIIGDEFTGQSNANGEGREVYLSLNANGENSIGIIHCHLDNGTTFKVFSLDDIIALAKIADLSTRPTNEFAIYVTTNSGTLALKINNKTLLTSKIDLMDMTYNDQEEEFSNKVKKEESFLKQKLGLVKFLSDMPLIGNPGIDLYEKVGNNWNKLGLSADGNSVTNTPCNQ